MIGIIIFHKDSRKSYEERWVQKFVDSIVNQTFKDFTIYEINYGGEDYSIISEYSGNSIKSHKFFNVKMENHVYAMNYIIDVAFSDGCDFVFNTNIDDYYDTRRIEKQLPYLESGVDICSTDFYYIRDNKGNDIVTELKRMSGFGDIRGNFNNGHNVIAHPSVAYSRKVWDDGNRYDGEKIPEEDFIFWKTLIEKGYRFDIVPMELLFYRLHNGQVSRVDDLPEFGEEIDHIRANKKPAPRIQIQTPVEKIRKIDKRDLANENNPVQPRQRQ